MNGFRFGASATIAPTFRSRFGPAVEAPADAGREASRRRSSGRARTGCPSTVRLPVGVEEAGDADDRVQLEQRERGRRVVEIDLARLDAAATSRPGKRVGVDLEADRQRGLRADARARRRRSSRRRWRRAAGACRPRRPRRRRCRSGRSGGPAPIDVACAFLTMTWSSMLANGRGWIRTWAGPEPGRRRVLGRQRPTTERRELAEASPGDRRERHGNEFGAHMRLLARSLGVRSGVPPTPGARFAAGCLQSREGGQR